MMSDKNSHKNMTKKSGKTIKEKRLDKRAKAAGTEAHDAVGQIKKK